MSRKTAFDAYVKTADQAVQREIARAIDPLHAYLEKASLKDLSRLAATDQRTLGRLRDLVKVDPDAPRLLPGAPSADVLDVLAAVPQDVLKFLQKIPAGPPHHATAQSKIDESHAAVKSWFDDWKDHATGILDVHKGILDGTHKTGGDMFAAFAKETVSAYATASHWLLRPYVKKK